MDKKKKKGRQEMEQLKSDGRWKRERTTREMGGGGNILGPTVSRVVHISYTHGACNTHTLVTVKEA